MDFLQTCVTELLHIDDWRHNKLIDLNGDLRQTYFLDRVGEETAPYALRTLAARLGKPANTVLRGSALTAEEQRIGRNQNTFDWRDGLGVRDARALGAFIADTYRELNLKGNNPLFLGVGALEWRVPVGNGAMQTVLSPLLVFPVRLVRASSATPVSLEFVDDDAYFNPCLRQKLRQTFGDELADAFPHPNGEGADPDAPLSLQALGDGGAYFARAAAFAESCRAGDPDAVFRVQRDIVAVARYNHGEICTYYDVKNNAQKIARHPLVRRVFEGGLLPDPPARGEGAPYVLSHDSVQEDIVERVTAGESLVVKGPPGTGKTVTIANLVAALLAQNKSVLFASRKLSALSEVYAKLPESLRKFVMLLDCETESQAAKVNPDAIRADFRALLRSRRAAGDLYERRERAEQERTRAVLELDGYHRQMFEGSPSYYDILNTALRSSAPVVRFVSPEAALAAQGSYAAAASAAAEAAECLWLMTGGGAHPVYRCPWYGADEQAASEKAFQSYTALAARAGRVRASVLAWFGERGERLPLTAIPALREGGFGPQEVRAVAEAPAEVRRAVAEDLAAYEQAAAEGEDAALADGSELFARLKAIVGVRADPELTLEQLRAVGAHVQLFFRGETLLGAAEFSALDASAAALDEIGRLQKDAFARVCAVFPEPLIQDGALLERALVAFSAYETDAVGPGLFDFRAKKLYKALQKESFLQQKGFGTVLKAVRAYGEMKELAARAVACRDRISGLLRRAASEEEICLLQSVFARSRAQDLPPRDYVCAALDALPVAEACAGALVRPPARLGALFAAYRSAARRALLERSLGLLGAGLPAPADGAACKRQARAAAAVGELVGRFGVQEACALAARIAEAPAALKGEVGELLQGFAAFRRAHFGGYYTDGTLSAGDLAVFSAEADDRAVTDAALRYRRALTAVPALDLQAFFRPFERGDLPLGKREAMCDTFEHSYYTLLSEAYAARLGARRNALGAAAARAMDRFAEAERTISACNAAVIADTCLSRLHADDPDFAFLQSERSTGESLRLFFKRHAAAILKLKRCIVLSPYTASVLFRPEAYASFDVVIVDEASQLKPVHLLPVLMRAKQCVIVGDEYQMPPIRHFETRAKTPAAEEEPLEPDISALSLALKGGGLRAAELVCHYRSQTESLIAFSQKNFYPAMRTFPASLPMAKGLGFTDVYVPQGACEEAANEAEAEAVLAALRAHFDAWYDEKSGVLSRSFGVVAFGEAQTQLIERRVREDRSLRERLTRALAAFGDVAEKLAFFKTIETVQGQETDHLILSLTYGRRADGRVEQSFGQLNRDDLGKCIFNVAVTRARYAVTVVHSVRAEEIVNPRVAYIGEYLALCERFARGGKERFACEDPGPGFLRSVADFIISCGVSPERVVAGYGVTAGSVRIPVAVLSEDLSRAVFGVWCELPTHGKYDFFDYNVRYYESLKARGWNLYRLFLHDWTDNAQAEREALERALADNQIINARRS